MAIITCAPQPRRLRLKLYNRVDDVKVTKFDHSIDRAKLQKRSRSDDVDEDGIDSRPTKRRQVLARDSVEQVVLSMMSATLADVSEPRGDVTQSCDCNVDDGAGGENSDQHPDSSSDHADDEADSDGAEEERAEAKVSKNGGGDRSKDESREEGQSDGGDEVKEEERGAKRSVAEHHESSHQQRPTESRKLSSSARTFVPQRHEHQNYDGASDNDLDTTMATAAESSSEARSRAKGKQMEPPPYPSPWSEVRASPLGVDELKSTGKRTRTQDYIYDQFVVDLQSSRSQTSQVASSTAARDERSGSRKLPFANFNSTEPAEREATAQIHCPYPRQVVDESPAPPKPPEAYPRLSPLTVEIFLQKKEMKRRESSRDHRVGGNSTQPTAISQLVPDPVSPPSGSRLNRGPHTTRYRDSRNQQLAGKALLEDLKSVKYVQSLDELQANHLLEIELVHDLNSLQIQDEASKVGPARPRSILKKKNVWGKDPRKELKLRSARSTREDSSHGEVKMDAVLFTPRPRKNDVDAGSSKQPSIHSSNRPSSSKPIHAQIVNLSLNEETFVQSEGLAGAFANISISADISAPTEAPLPAKISAPAPTPIEISAPAPIPIKISASAPAPTKFYTSTEAPASVEPPATIGIPAPAQIPGLTANPSPIDLLASENRVPTPPNDSPNPADQAADVTGLVAGAVPIADVPLSQSSTTPTATLGQAPAQADDSTTPATADPVANTTVQSKPVPEFPTPTESTSTSSASWTTPVPVSASGSSRERVASPVQPPAKRSVASTQSDGMPVRQTPEQITPQHEHAPPGVYDAYFAIGSDEDISLQSEPHVDFMGLYGDSGMTVPNLPEASSSTWQAPLRDTQFAPYVVHADEAFGDDSVMGILDGSFPLPPYHELASQQPDPRFDTYLANFNWDASVPAGGVEGAPFEPPTSWHGGVDVLSIQQMTPPPSASRTMHAASSDAAVATVASDTVIPALRVDYDLPPDDPYFFWTGSRVGRILRTESGDFIYTAMLTPRLMEWLSLQLTLGSLGPESAALLSVLPGEVVAALTNVTSFAEANVPALPLFWEYGPTMEICMIAFLSEGAATSSSNAVSTHIPPAESAVHEESPSRATSDVVPAVTFLPTEPAAHEECAPRPIFELFSPAVAPSPTEPILERAEYTVPETESEVPEPTLDSIILAIFDTYVHLEYAHCTQEEIFVTADAYFPTDGSPPPIRTVDPEAVQRLLCVEEAERLMCEAMREIVGQMALGQSSFPDVPTAAMSSPSTPILSRAGTASPLSSTAPATPEADILPSPRSISFMQALNPASESRGASRQEQFVTGSA